MTKLSDLWLGSVRGIARFARRSFKSSHGFSKSRAARAFLFFFLLPMPLSQALSKPVVQPAQISSTNEGLTLFAEGRRLDGLGTRTARMEAIDKYKAAYECFRKDNHRVGMGMALFAVGGAYMSLGQKRRALNTFLDASPYIKETGDPSLRVIILAVIGLVHTKLSEWKAALEYLDQALALLQTEKNPELLATVLASLGGTYIKLGKKQKGLEYLERSLSLVQETDDRDLETKLLAVMGTGFSSLGQRQKGLELTQRALQLARGQKDRSNEARALMSLGEIHNAMGDRQGALRDYNEALQVGQEAIDRAWKPTVLSNMAAIYLDFGDLDRSLALYEAAIKASEIEGEPEDAALGLNGLAMIADLRAEPLKALSSYQRALTLARAVKDHSREAGALANIAGVYALFNQYELALNAIHEALAIYRDDENPSGESTTLANMGKIYERMGRYGEAIESLNRALALQRANENREGQAHTLLGLGDAYRNSGDQAKAIESYTESLALMTAVEDRVGETKACIGLGLTYYEQGNFQKASEYFLRNLALTRAAGLRGAEAGLLACLGLLHEDMGDLKAAEALYEQSLEVIEHIRAGARLEEFKTEIAGGTAELYSRAILLKLKSGKPAEAFELSEKARARTLLDQMNSARINIRKSADRELIEQEQALRFELASLEKKLTEEMSRGGAPEACAPLRERLNQGREAYAGILIRMKASTPEYAELQGYSPASLVEIQRLLPPETTLLSYYVTTSKTLVFVITRDSLNVVELPVSEKELQNSIAWFRSFASLRDTERASLKQLSAGLIAPVRQHIKTPRVGVIPHGILYQLPFAALYDGKNYFGEQHAIYYLPAASLLPVIEKRKRPTGTRMLALAQADAAGWPSLHYVDQEAGAIARLCRGKALLTGQALKAEFLRLAGDYHILHIASHAEFNTRSPLFSRILLTPDQNGNQGLEVREVYDLNLSSTSLVVLSACETQLGVQSKGDDVVGLNRAFIFAGASTVLASLWTVDDQATGRLMRSFYTHLKRGIGKAEALRMAQSETRRQYPNPYYWAAFVLTGEPGAPKRLVAHEQVFRRNNRVARR
jgi:CHAT domain-containing protein/Flp pilus assembly protein TadD